MYHRPNGPTPLQHDLKIKLFNENLKLVLPFGKNLLKVKFNKHYQLTIRVNTKRAHLPSFFPRKHLPEPDHNEVVASL